MGTRLFIAAIAVAFSTAVGAALADEPNADDLVKQARDILDQRNPDFEKAQAAIEAALATKAPRSPALVQKARLVLMLGGESRESLQQASQLLEGARNLDFGYGPAYVWQAYVYMKLGQGSLAGQALFKASRLVPDDPQFLYVNATYLASGMGDPYPFYERYVESHPINTSQLFDAEQRLLQYNVGAGNRAKADAAFEGLIRITPDTAELYGDYAREVMTSFADFDAGERLARKAISLRDYPHARQSLSLALYGKWADARRRNAGTAETAALYEVAKKNDPGAHNVPSCALDSPHLMFLKESLEKIRDPAAALTNC